MNVFTSGFLNGMRQRMCLMLCAIFMIGTSASAQTQLAAWTFDATAGTPNTPTSVTANLGAQMGTATLYANGTNGSSTWLQATELDAFAGTVINDPRGGGAVAGNTYSIKSNTANGKALVLAFSTLGFENPVLTFATRGTGTGFATHQWAWSTDGSTFTNFGTNTATTGTTFLARTLDMSTIDAVDNAAMVYLRLTVSGATATGGNNRLDNFVVNATAITGGPAPEVTGGDFNGNAGVAFSHQVVATNSPSSYTVASGSLPPGITLNSSTGLISGTPTNVGAYTANITASNGTVSAPAAFNFNIAQGSQTITFDLIPSMPVSDPPYMLTATASSGLTVTYTSSDNNVATVSGNMVTFVAPGSTVITASQAGDANFTAAVPVEQTLTVLAAATNVTYLGGATAIPANVPGGTTVSDISAGNNFGTPTLLSTGSPSTGYTGATGGTNAGAAARTGALDTTQSAYFSFTLTPDAGKQVTLFDISFGSRSTATGPQAFSLRSSIDNYATELAGGTMSNNSTWALHDPVTTATTAYPSIPVTYRIYGANGTGTASSGTVNWRIDDLTIRILVENMGACNGTIEAGTASADLPGPFCETGATSLTMIGNTNPATTLGVTLQWYSSTDNINFTAIDGATAATYNTESITETTYYYAVANCTISGSADTTNLISLEVSEMPEITGDLVVCAGGSTLLTSSSALSYQWNLDGNPIPGATTQTFLADVAGDYTVTTTTDAGCILTSDVATVVIGGTLTAPEVTGLTNMCPFEGTGEEVTFAITPQPGVTSYNWVVPPSLNIVSGQGTDSLTVTVLPGFRLMANKQVRVTGSSACGTTPMSIFYLKAHAPVSPGFITGPDEACPFVGTAATATYSIPPVIAATSYNWTVPAGATIESHPNGLGENDTIITVSFSPAYTTGDIIVEAVNNCGISNNARHLTVVRNNPSTPGLIAGSNNACTMMPSVGNPTGTSSAYTINSVDGATSYNWAVPAGATIESHPNGPGENDTTIIVSFSSGFTGGEITVTATDNCGTSQVRSLKVSASLQPASIGNITATETQSCPDRMVQYSINMPSNATWVQWTVPAQGSIMSGQGSNTITVQYTAGPVSGEVTATASNGCATGSTRTLAVDLGPCGPPPPFAKIPGNGNFVPGVQVDLLDASVFPNPSASTFRVKVNAYSTEKMQVRVFDVQGKPVETFLLRGGETRSFGEKLMPGAYFIEVIRGKQRQVKQVTKL